MFSPYLTWLVIFLGILGVMAVVAHVAYEAGTDRARRRVMTHQQHTDHQHADYAYNQGQPALGGGHDGQLELPAGVTHITQVTQIRATSTRGPAGFPAPPIPIRPGGASVWQRPSLDHQQTSTDLDGAQ